MELETLKTIWQEAGKSPYHGHTMDKDHIQSLMKKKSQTTFANIKRSMRLKAVAAGVIGTFVLAVSVVQLLAITEEPILDFSFLSAFEMGLVAAVMSMVVLTVAAVNFIGYRRITRFECSTRPLKAMLEESVVLLRRIMMIGVYSDAIFTPAIAGFVAYIWLFQRQEFAWDIRLIYLVMIMAGTAFFAYVTANWLMQGKHGSHLNKLQGYLKELKLSNGNSYA
ncbi:MAG: hypothetical protein U5K31_03300 [Balneolaceae bacterium]|nr:hypothetical protein [Balneolaceae bacterium]